MTIGDHSEYYAQQAQDTIDKLKGFNKPSVENAPNLPMGSGVLMNPPQGNTINSNITFNIDGANNPNVIVDQMKNYISSEHRKLEKGQFSEK
jgi:hypothetical protein